MKIVLATPLYPPEIALPAPYVKELAKRLSEKGHSITIITYGRLPEKIEGVEIITVSKRDPLPVRLLRYMISLSKESRHADMLYIQNGASVELPALLVSFFRKKPFVIGISDKDAHNRSKKSFILSTIEKITKSRAKITFDDMPLEKPEIIPFEEYPEAEMEQYEVLWSKHIDMLIKIFKND